VPSNESFTVRIRYKRPDGHDSQLIEQGVVDDNKDLAQSSEDFRFAASVAGFGMRLRESPHKGTLTYAGLLELTEPLVARDSHGYRREFTELVKRAKSLSRP
jgi:Ca-activated chloride channel homolog